MLLLRRSRRRTSLRVSQPLRSLSYHACPNCSREYPVFGARPFTVSVATAASAVPFAAGVGATVDFEGVGVGLAVGAAVAAAVGVAVAVSVGVAVGVGVGVAVGVDLLLPAF